YVSSPLPSSSAFLSLYRPRPHRDLHSFPTRRSSDLTAAIAPSGHVGAVLNPGSAGILDVEVQGTQGLTPYVKWGNMPILAWSLFMLLAGIAYRKREGLAQKI